MPALPRLPPAAPAEIQRAGGQAWLDDSEITLGALLSKELQDSIRASRVLLLLWSRQAASARWVKSEWLTAFHLNRFIVSCVLDDTLMPQCLQGNTFLRMRQVTKPAVEQLLRAVREAPGNSNPIAPVMRSESPEVNAAVVQIAAGQRRSSINLRRVNSPRRNNCRRS